MFHHNAVRGQQLVVSFLLFIQWMVAPRLEGQLQTLVRILFA
jgi:hypothetical protein